jgi:hypothetical protein
MNIKKSSRLILGVVILPLVFFLLSCSISDIPPAMEGNVEMAIACITVIYESCPTEYGTIADVSNIGMSAKSFKDWLTEQTLTRLSKNDDLSAQWRLTSNGYSAGVRSVKPNEEEKKMLINATYVVKNNQNITFIVKGKQQYTVVFTNGEIGAMNGEIFVKEQTKMKLNDRKYVYLKNHWKNDK